MTILVHNVIATPFRTVVATYVRTMCQNFSALYHSNSSNIHSGDFRSCLSQPNIVGLQIILIYIFVDTCNTLLLLKEFATEGHKKFAIECRIEFATKSRIEFASDHYEHLRKKQPSKSTKEPKYVIRNKDISRNSSKFVQRDITQ